MADIDVVKKGAGGGVWFLWPFVLALFVCMLMGRG